MNVVKDLQSLIQLMHSRDEVIIFPVGAEGQTALDFFRYTNLLNRVCCIAVPEILGGVAQQFIHEVALLPFENLVHFRETALIITITPEQFQAHLDSELTRLGFKTVVFVNSETHAQIKSELQKLYSTGQVLMWYMQHFDRKIEELNFKLDEHSAIRDVNTKAFSEYRNAFRKKEVVVVGAGPTLNYYKPIANAVHIGVNRSWRKENVYLDFLFTGDNGLPSVRRVGTEKGFDKVHSKIFVAKSLSDSPYDACGFSEDVYFTADNIVPYHCAVADKHLFIHQDICYHPVADFFSVIFNAIQFALFTYPQKLYLAGCDVSSSGHFYSPERSGGNFAAWKVGYARIKVFARRYYPDTEIISINPVGLRGLFKDVYTEEYKAALDKDKN